MSEQNRTEWVNTLRVHKKTLMQQITKWGPSPHMAQSLQQPDSGRSRGGPRGPAPPPLIFGPNWGSKGPKIFWGDCFPPSSPFSLGLDLALPEHHKLTSPLKLTRSINLSLSDLHVLLNYFVQPFLLLNTVLEAILPDYEGSRYILHSPEVWHIYCNHSRQPHEEVCFHSEEEKKKIHRSTV